MAKCFSEQMKLDKCIFVPNRISPFKTEEHVIESIYRLEMVNIAVEGIDKFEVSDFELTNSQEISYTYLTLEHYRNIFPNDELFLLIGLDNAVNFDKWKNWELILNYVSLCIVDRPEIADKEGKEKIIKALSNKSKEPHWVSAPLMEISSSIIRSKVAKGFKINELVPKKVEEYIYEHNLYSNI
jgi:nicotinate-nucleotide adenylyltransferase